MTETFYTLHHVAKTLGIPTWRVKNHIKEGNLKKTKFGTRIAISKKDLDSFVKWYRDNES